MGGVLANDTPAMDQIAPTGLIYCPGMLDKAVRHDGCHVGGHLHTGGPSEPAPPPPKKKPDLILTLTATLQNETWHILATNVGGDTVCELKLEQTEKLSALNAAIEKQVNSQSEYTVKLVTRSGSIIESPPGTLIRYIFPAELVLKLTATLQFETWHIAATNNDGHTMCNLKIKSFEKFSTVKAA